MNKDKEIQVFEFDGKPITFELADGNKFVSATQMAQVFDRRLTDFLRLKQTVDFIKELHLFLEGEEAEIPKLKNEKRPSTENLAEAYPNIIRVIKGGEPTLQGTWIHERLSLKLAAWLSPKFELWVYNTIMQVMKKDTLILTGTEKTTYEWLLTKFVRNMDEMRVLLNHFPGQLPDNFRIGEDDDNLIDE